MNKVLPAIATFIYMTFFSNASFAKFDPPESLEVSFINNTGYDCTIESHLKHGQWHKEPPKTLPKNSTTHWVAIQKFFYGPDMTIKFTCGSYSFNAKNQQNYCELEGGNQTLNTSHVDKHLHVTNKQIQHASISGNKKGKAQIVVSLKEDQFRFE